MFLTILPPNGVAEYRAMTELLTSDRTGVITPEQLAGEGAPVPRLGVPRRVVAVNAAHTVVGTSYLRYEPWMRRGQLDLFLVVAPAYRQQGIGTQLYHEALVYAKTSGATALRAIVSDRAPEAQSFAQQCGFTRTQHWVYWELLLARFQETPFRAVLTEAHARGIRFFTLADAGNTPEDQRKLYDLNRQTSLDAPGEDRFPTFDEFITHTVAAPWFRPDGQIVAADEERWVGLGAVGVDGTRAFQAFTGVDRDYRRRRLAMALTLLTIQYARHQQATLLEVFNDSRNTPMFKLQAKLGYGRIPGRYMLRHVVT